MSGVGGVPGKSLTDGIPGEPGIVMSGVPGKPGAKQDIGSWTGIRA